MSYTGQNTYAALIYRLVSGNKRYIKAIHDYMVSMYTWVWKKENEKKNTHSPAGNRTRVFRVTGGDTYHYTTEDCTGGGTQHIVVVSDVY